MTPPSPTGRQCELRVGDAHAVITEVGATLRSFVVRGEDVIDGFSVDQPSPAGRGQVLAPWPNRLEDGTYAFDGHHGHADINEPERHDAIHGLVRWLPWSVSLETRDSVLLRCRLEAQPAYPWNLEVQVGYTITRNSLRVAARATNRSPEPAPFGIGFHPYLTVGTTSVDQAHLTIPAGLSLTEDERALPTGREGVAGTDLDFTTARAIGPLHMDTAFTDLRRDPRGRATVRLERPDGSRSVELWMEEEFRYAMVYTGDSLEPVGRRRRGLAVEPMTCPPNAFRSGVDLIALEPGTSWSGDWGIRV